MTVNGAQLEVLTKAIAAYFDSADLARAFTAIFDTNLNSITADGRKLNVIFELIVWADRTGNLLVFLNGLKEENASEVFRSKIKSVLNEMSEAAPDLDPQ